MPASAVVPSVPLPVPANGRPDRTHRGDHRRAGRRGGGHDDAGQTTVLVALVVALGLLMLVALTRLGEAVVDRARARTAADAAALAGVIEEPRGGGAGRRSATDIATANGATLVGYDVDGTTVEVTVRVDDAHATSRAERRTAAGG